MALLTWVHRRLGVLLLLALVALPLPALAEESLDDLLGGFDDGTDVANDVDVKSDTFTASEKKSAFDLTGFFTSSTATNIAHEAPTDGTTDYRGLSRMRGEVQVDLRVTLPESWKIFVSGRSYYDAAYAINGRDNYTDENLDSLEQETEWRDAWLQGSLTKNLDIKTGRQLVVWGTSDNIRVVDIINPLDLREPGMVDIEDLRLPVTMTRLDYYLGDWNLSGMVIHEKRFHKVAPFGSDFFPIHLPLPPEDIGDDQEYAAALKGIFDGWDISFHYAKLYDRQFHIEGSITTPPTRWTRSYSMLTLVGVAADYVTGSWLIKSEAAKTSGVEYFSRPDKTFGQSDYLVGVEYSGIIDATISAEVALRKIEDFDPVLANKPDDLREEEWQTAIRLQYDMMNSRLHLLGLVSTFGLQGELGAFQRISGKYEMSDELAITIGAIFYQPGEKMIFAAIADNDRIFLDLKYSL